MQLVSTNVPGNIHGATGYINEIGLAKYVIHMECSGNYTIVVFKVLGSMAPRLRKFFNQLPEYQANPPKTKWTFK